MCSGGGGAGLGKPFHRRCKEIIRAARRQWMGTPTGRRQEGEGWEWRGLAPVSPGLNGRQKLRALTCLPCCTCCWERIGWEELMESLPCTHIPREQFAQSHCVCKEGPATRRRKRGKPRTPEKPSNLPSTHSRHVTGWSGVQERSLPAGPLNLPGRFLLFLYFLYLRWG